MILGWEPPGSTRSEPSIAHAVATARGADAVVVGVGLSPDFESEGRDVADFRLPAGQDELVAAVAAANPNTVVVVYGGVPQLLAPWIDKVRAVFIAMYPGQEGGSALADLLFGRLSPSGRLPFSYIQNRDQSPAFADYRNPDLKSRYTEGVFVGYRHLERARLDPLFPFGHGLTYSWFTYSELNVEPGPHGTATASLEITNTGKVEAEETVQLYVAPPQDTPLPRPLQELKAFAKVALAPGERRTITLPLGRRAFEYYDSQSGGWTLFEGNYQIRVGASSRDIRLTAPLQVHR
jgi:beta-glucosidase